MDNFEKISDTEVREIPVEIIHKKSDLLIEKKQFEKKIYLAQMGLNKVNAMLEKLK